MNKTWYFAVDYQIPTCLLATWYRLFCLKQSTEIGHMLCLAQIVSLTLLLNIPFILVIIPKETICSKCSAKHNVIWQSTVVLHKASSLEIIVCTHQQSNIYNMLILKSGHTEAPLQLSSENLKFTSCNHQCLTRHRIRWTCLGLNKDSKKLPKKQYFSLCINFKADPLLVFSIVRWQYHCLCVAVLQSMVINPRQTSCPNHRLILSPLISGDLCCTVSSTEKTKDKIPRCFSKA